MAADDDLAIEAEPARRGVGCPACRRRAAQSRRHWRGRRRHVDRREQSCESTRPSVVATATLRRAGRNRDVPNESRTRFLRRDHFEELLLPCRATDAGEQVGCVIGWFLLSRSVQFMAKVLSRPRHAPDIPHSAAGTKIHPSACASAESGTSPEAMGVEELTVATHRNEFGEAHRGGDFVGELAHAVNDRDGSLLAASLASMGHGRAASQTASAASSRPGNAQHRTRAERDRCRGLSRGSTRRRARAPRLPTASERAHGRRRRDPLPVPPMTTTASASSSASAASQPASPVPSSSPRLNAPRRPRRCRRRAAQWRRRSPRHAAGSGRAPGARSARGCATCPAIPAAARTAALHAACSRWPHPQQHGLPARRRRPAGSTPSPATTGATISVRPVARHHDIERRDRVGAGGHGLTERRSASRPAAAPAHRSFASMVSLALHRPAVAQRERHGRIAARPRRGHITGQNAADRRGDRDLAWRAPARPARRCARARRPAASAGRCAADCRRQTTS